MTTSITNRHGLKIVVEVLEPKAKPVGLAFVMHGLGGFRKQDQIQAIAESCLKKNYVTVIFDTTNTLGDSEGSYELATITNYYEDLEDVIIWTKLQSFYISPFILIGHSVGGYCITKYTQLHKNDVKGISPISAVVSGNLLNSSPKFLQIKDEWKKKGVLVSQSNSKPGVEKRLRWYPHVADRDNHDLLRDIHYITCPVIQIVGSKESRTGVEHQKLLFRALPDNIQKELHVIDGAKHTFREQNHLDTIQSILENWIDTL